VTPPSEREAVMARARSRFEALLSLHDEGICIASLPLMVEEIAAEEAGDDHPLELELITQLRRRAGLSV
jgi:hypothetical protein